jgi:hypothetical protein
MVRGLKIWAVDAINLPNTLFQGRIKVKILLFCRPFAVARARNRVNSLKDQENEAYISAKPSEARTQTWFPGPHVNPWWKSHHPGTSRQGP